MTIRKFAVHLPFVYFLLYAGLPALTQPLQSSRKILPEIALSKAEIELYNRINDYRKFRGLKPVPLSKSLTIVAQAHVRDLAENQPSSKRCNLHSWSSAGNWSACCYTENQTRADCMWEKPRELTNYQGEGYECAYWTDEVLAPVDFASKALRGWKSSPHHNNVIINSAEWKRLEWNAMGVGCYGGYAVIWFGTEPDDEGNSDAAEN